MLCSALTQRSEHHMTYSHTGDAIGGAETSRPVRRDRHVRSDGGGISTCMGTCPGSPAAEPASVRVAGVRNYRIGDETRLQILNAVAESWMWRSGRLGESANPLSEAARHSLVRRQRGQ